MVWFFATTVVFLGALGLNVVALAVPLLLVAAYWNLALTRYILKDLRLRGASAIWVFVPGFGLLVWLVWRGSHPLPIRKW